MLQILYFYNFCIFTKIFVDFRRTGYENKIIYTSNLNNYFDLHV